MCRALMYLGKQPILVDDLLYKTDSSLVKQAYQPRYMHEFNNLAGFGLIGWAKGENNIEPFIYRTTALPFFDRNLKALVTKLYANCLVAHVRGAPYSENSVIDSRNIHPFKFPDVNLVLAHNGDLFEFKKMRYQLISRIKPEFASFIEGTTDSECVYALLISQLADPFGDITLEEVVEAIVKTIKIIREVRELNGIDQASPLNLFISNGTFLVATRFVFDFGHFTKRHNIDDLAYQSLWYTFGNHYGLVDGQFQMLNGEAYSSIIVASEPLTSDVTTWLEVPEYSILTARLEGTKIQSHVYDIE